jgi:hypothetical protein
MMANSTRRAASQSTLAPTSRNVVRPFGCGMLATSAGRSRSALMRRMSLEMAIRAPVLPAETAAAACPSRIASTAFHIEVPLPRRMAWAGFSSIEITRSECRTSERAARAGSRDNSACITVSSPCSSRRAPGISARAWAQAGITTDGPWSPPMASTEITRDRVNSALSSLGGLKPDSPRQYAAHCSLETKPLAR